MMEINIDKNINCIGKTNPSHLGKANGADTVIATKTKKNCKILVTDSGRNLASKKLKETTTRIKTNRI